MLKNNSFYLLHKTSWVILTIVKNLCNLINEYNEEVQKIKDNCSPNKTSPTKLINGAVPLQ